MPALFDHMSSEHIDIIVYAVIAILLLARLWVVFGRRNEDDPQRPNPFTPPPDSGDEAMILPRRDKKNVQPEMPALPSPFALKAAPQSLAGKLEQVRQIDPGFDEKTFLQDARAIFAAVVGDYAKGDLTPSLRYLDPLVRKGLDAAILERREKGESAENRVARVKEAEVTDARTEARRVIVAARLVSEQENILRDSGGKIISGAPGALEEVTDIWTFAREAKPGAEWQVIETR